MLALVTLFWQICMLRSGPERVPEQPLLLGALLVIDVAVQVTFALLVPASEETGLQDLNLVQALTLSLVGMAIVAAGIWLPLRLRRQAHRFGITLTALLGCDVLLSLVGFALLPLAAVTGSMAVLAWGSLAILVWWVTIAGHVLAAAAEVPRLQASVLALCLILVANILGQQAAMPAGGGA